jgi:hypothetical protein
VGQQQRREGGELDGEVAIGDAVQGVASSVRSKPRARAVCLAVDGEGRAGQGRGAEGALVHAPAAVQQASVVALEHLVPGQQVMAEGHRLRDLQVRKAGHDRVRVLFRRDPRCRAAGA